jgi:hypothetical protein
MKKVLLIAITLCSNIATMNKKWGWQNDPVQLEKRKKCTEICLNIFLAEKSKASAEFLQCLKNDTSAQECHRLKKDILRKYDLCRDKCPSPYIFICKNEDCFDDDDDFSNDPPLN